MGPPVSQLFAYVPKLVKRSSYLTGPLGMGNVTQEETEDQGTAQTF